MSKPIELREADFRREVEKYAYSKEIKDEFFEYWTEPDRAPSPKMRFEKEKTWHMGRRLARWVRTSKTSLPAAIVHKDSNPPPKNPETDFDRLDMFIMEMKRPGSNVKFEDFGVWYEFMRDNRLLKKLYDGEVQQLQQMYNYDKEKCRCAVVQMTLAGYVTREVTIADIMNLRKRLEQAR